MICFIFAVNIRNSWIRNLFILRLCKKIPAPNFIEFYNGSTAVPDCAELRLSSAFEHLSGEPKLELIVTVLNVNEGHNAELMQHCNTLNEICAVCCQSAALCSGYVFRSGRGTCRRRVYQGRDFSRISYLQPKRGHQYEYL